MSDEKYSDQSMLLGSAGVTAGLVGGLASGLLMLDKAGGVEKVIVGFIMLFAPAIILGGVGYWLGGKMKTRQD